MTARWIEWGTSSTADSPELAAIAVTGVRVVDGLNGTAGAIEEALIIRSARVSWCGGVEASAKIRISISSHRKRMLSTGFVTSTFPERALPGGAPGRPGRALRVTRARSHGWRRRESVLPGRRTANLDRCAHSCTTLGESFNRLSRTAQRASEIPSAWTPCRAESTRTSMAFLRIQGCRRSRFCSIEQLPSSCPAHRQNPDPSRP